jgi:hypothetical protein
MKKHNTSNASPSLGPEGNGSQLNPQANPVMALKPESESTPKPKTNGNTNENAFEVPPSPSPVEKEFNFADMEVAPGLPDSLIDIGLDVVRVGKPNDEQYVFFYPEIPCYWVLPENRVIRRDAYVVVPQIGEAHMALCRKAMLACWVDSYGNHGVWPILQESATTRRVSDWSASALRNVREALQRKEWLAVRSTPGVVGYGLHKPYEGDLGAPKFRPEPVGEIIMRAFDGHIIKRHDDPVLLKAIGQRINPNGPAKP